MNIFSIGLWNFGNLSICIIHVSIPLPLYALPSLNDGCGNDCEVGKLCLDNKYGTIAIQMSKNASYISIQDGVRCWLAIDRIERSYEATTILLLLLVTSTVGCMIEYFRYLPIPIYLALFVIAGFTLISWRYKW